MTDYAATTLAEAQAANAIIGAYLAGLALPAPVEPPVEPPVIVEPPQSPTTAIPIANQAALIAALASAKGGEVFTCQPGSYNLTLANKVYASPVTVTSADPAKPAKFGFTKLTSISNLTLKGLEMGFTSAVGAATEGAAMLKATTCKNITLDGNYIHGSLDDNPGNDAFGVMFSNCSGTRIINNRMEQLGRGGQIFGGSDITVSHNKLTGIRSDGFDFSGLTGVVIEGNAFANFKPKAGDHPDAIQFQTYGATVGSKDITIRNNVMVTGSGGGFQGIFLRDETGKLPYQRVTIVNNIVIGSYLPNGIMVSHGDDITVNDNTVVSPIDDALPVWIRMGGDGPVTNLKMARNIADQGGQKAPGQIFSADQMALLKTASLPKIKAADLVVPDWGYQP